MTLDDPPLSCLNFQVSYLGVVHLEVIAKRLELPDNLVSDWENVSSLGWFITSHLIYRWDLQHWQWRSS